MSATGGAEASLSPSSCSSEEESESILSQRESTSSSGGASVIARAISRASSTSLTAGSALISTAHMEDGRESWDDAETRALPDSGLLSASGWTVGMVVCTITLSSVAERSLIVSRDPTNAVSILSIGAWGLTGALVLPRRELLRDSRLVRLFEIERLNELKGWFLREFRRLPDCDRLNELKGWFRPH